MDINSDYSGSTIGKYYLEEKIGNGSFGSVYKAKDRILSSYKAIKILKIADPHKAHELFLEASIPHKCHHANIVKVHSGELLNFNGNLLFVVDMELVSGGSLEKNMSTRVLSTLDSVAYAKNILFGLQHAHTQGAIHRDIKPANVLIDNGIPKISDFGLASSLNSTISPWKWYYTHAAPETFTSSMATVGTDIFAFGMTFYRMLHHISNWAEFIAEIPNYESLIERGRLIDKLKFSPHIPQQLVRIIRKACHCDPDKRFASASEMRNALEKLKPKYSWLFSSDNICIGTCYSAPNRTIILERKKTFSEFVVKNGDRRITADCCRFEHYDEAELHMLSYLANTTFH